MKTLMVVAPVVLLVMLAAAADAPPAPAERPTPRTHAHNDYEHEHPLFDALHHGFVGVEADIYLVGKDLRVSHEAAKDWSKVPTLEAAYLTPLRDLVKRRNSGGVYADGTPVLLLVDIKTDGESTYGRLHEMLAAYQAATPGLFTTFTRDGRGSYTTKAGAVTVVISGNRPREAMKRQTVRLAGYDGRIADIASDSTAFAPLISDNWNAVFTGEIAWDGTGEIPRATRRRLDELVAQVHGQKKLLRFWNLPKDAPAVWGPLYDAGVDLINTDDLAGLAKFIASRKAR